ncbi:MAG: fimbrial biogenesis outer membrane usher protein [Rhodocyclaceae bacterium]|nr:fimbrial biogenesis outer membrane usher protein [Rhodocyclaceae bacterium]
MLRCLRLIALLLTTTVFGSAALSTPIPRGLDDGSGEELFITLTLNGQEKGTIFAVIDADGLWVKTEDLKQAGLNILEGRTRFWAGESLIRAYTLANAKVNFDEEEQHLTLDIDPDLLGNQVIDLSSEPQEPLTPEPAINGYLNWSVDRQQAPGYNATGATAALNLRAAGWLLRSDHDWLEGRDQTHIRYGTALTRDWPEPALRLTLGDAQAYSGDLGRSRSMAGVTFARAFELRPGFETSPAANLATTISRPSVAEIYVDGSMVRTVNLNPGTVDFSNLRYFTGLRNTEVVIRDDFGNRSVISLPFYFTSDVLDAGLQDFSYTVGFLRPDSTRDDYDRTAFSAFHRYGVTDRITIGARADGVQGLWSAGPNIAVRIPRGGVVSAAWSKSGGSDAPKTGDASTLGWNWSEGNFSANVQQRRYSEYYAFDAALSAFQITPIKRALAGGANLSVYGAGTFSISGDTISYWGAPDERRTTLGYSMSVLGRLSISATVSHLTGGRTGTEAAITLAYSFSDRVSATATRQRNSSGDYTSQMRISTPQPPGEGWGASVTSTRAPTLNTMEATAGVNLSHAQLGASVRRDDQNGFNPTTSWRVGAGSSIAFASGAGFFVTRPIEQSFAIVKVGQLADVAVLQGSQVLGRTNADGVLIAPDVNSLNPMTFGLRDGDIPMEYALGATTRQILPPQNAGILVNFGLKRIHALTGKLFANMGETRVAVANRQAAIWTSDMSRPRDMPIGQDGLFYLEDMIQGAYVIAVKLPEGQCSVQIVLAEHEGPAFDLGEITCEIEPGS